MMNRRTHHIVAGQLTVILVLTGNIPKNSLNVTYNHATFILTQTIHRLNPQRICCYGYPRN